MVRWKKKITIPKLIQEEPGKESKWLIYFNIINGQIDPVVKTYLQAPGNKLGDQVNENTVDWKHKLDEKVAKLNAAAKVQGVQVPLNYYYGFSDYLSQAPAEAKTGVLSKQLLAIEEMSNIMIGAPVNAIKGIHRTAEESSSMNPNISNLSGNFMPGHSAKVAGGIYTVYPFEIEFDATTDTLRKVVDDLMQSPYVFVIRGVALENSQPASPQLGDLDKIAGAQQPTTSVIDSPGAVAASKSTAGPQYLFGSEILHVRVRLDMIEWRGLAPEPSAAGSKTAKPGAKPAPSAGN